MSETRHGRPHRWTNSAAHGATHFVTTTCLDFVPCFQRPEMRELASVCLLRDCQMYRLQLHAFVVMTHHLHIVLTLPEDRAIPWAMQRLKSNLAKLALPRLSESDLARLGLQAGLNRRTFWQPSFRGLEVVGADMFDQKVRYTHLNPVRAGLVEEDLEYRWSSRRFWEMELWSPELGLDLDRVLEGFDQSLNTRVADLP